MPNVFEHLRWRTLVQPVAIAALVGPLVAWAQVAQPVLSGPSTAKAAQEITMNGAGLAPNSAVSVVVRAPGLPDAYFGAVVGSDGNLAYRYVPRTPGQHVLKVVDTAGKELASALVMVAP